jgi:N-acyl-D-aspartate/D-glutamate deacylase
MTTSSYLFRSATVISGDASLPSEADVLISSGKIVAIGPHIDVHPELNDDTIVIDTLGLVLCPGFIDMHAHSDLYLLTHPGHEPKVSQGVTTEVVGQDGESQRPKACRQPCLIESRCLLFRRNILLPYFHFGADDIRPPSDRWLERQSVG